LWENNTLGYAREAMYTLRHHGGYSTPLGTMVGIVHPMYVPWVAWWVYTS